MHLALMWVKHNLFSTKLNSVLTLMMLLLVYILAWPFIRWAIIDATWLGSTREDCAINSGACWVFIKVRFEQFMYGFYPLEARWRVNLGFILLLLGLCFYGVKWINKYYLTLALVVVFPIIAFILFYGGFGLPVIRTSLWGGLFLTLVIASMGIVAAFPLGVLLALGRRSSMPVVKALCIGFIEMVRGIPLISVLFMASVMFPLFVPDTITLDKLVRALIGIILFQAAYMAEVVRGGLQAIPKGQYEAAKTLGLGYWQMMGLVILPQALKTVIPGIVNTVIGLFKDTTLVLIIGLFDFLGIVQAATTDPMWLGMAVEGYVFCAVVYWLFCFSMSKYSQRLERHK